MPLDLTANPIFATAASAVIDGVALDTAANGATMAIGDEDGANGFWAALRFDVSSLDGYEVTDLILKLTLSASNTPGESFQVMLANFGASITEADYVRTVANMLEDKSNAFRIPLETIIVADVAVTSGTVIEVQIPSHAIKTDDNFIDILILPTATGALGATDLFTIHGPAAASDANKPQLNGAAYTREELNDPAISSSVRCPETGDAVMAVGFEIEPKYGVPMKSRIGLMTTNYTLAGRPRNLTSNAKTRDRTKPVMQAPGRDHSEGNVSFEMTPESWLALMRGMFSLMSTTDLGVIDGTQTYQHVFLPSRQCDDASFTFWDAEAFEQIIHRGVKIGDMTLTVPEDGIVTVDLGLMGLGAMRYDQNAAGEDSQHLLADSYATDRSQGLISDRNVTTMLDDVVETSNMITASTISITRALEILHGQTGKREGSNIAAGKPTIGVTLDMYFRTEEQCRAYYGVAHDQYPYKSYPSVIEQDLKMSIVGPKGSAVQEILIEVPKLSYSMVDISQTDDQVVRLQAQGTGNIDSSIESGIRVTVKCSHPASFFNAGAEQITVLPAGVPIVDIS